MNRIKGIIVAGVMTWGTVLSAAIPTGLPGDWKTPEGSVVRVSQCGDAFCMAIVTLGPTAKGTTDQLNPDLAFRGRPLCGLRIGDGFKRDGEASASGGHVYDPESGKTYSAKLAWKGESLRLRGFIGVSLFGRTEVWRKIEAVTACK